MLVTLGRFLPSYGTTSYVYWAINQTVSRCKPAAWSIMSTNRMLVTIALAVPWPHHTNCMYSNWTSGYITGFEPEHAGWNFVTPSAMANPVHYIKTGGGKRLESYRFAYLFPPGDLHPSSHWIMQSLHWHHNDHDSVSKHQPHGCLLNRLFSRRSKKTSMPRVTGLCVGNSPGPVNSPHKGPVTRKMFPFDDVIMCTGHVSNIFFTRQLAKATSNIAVT